VFLSNVESVLSAPAQEALTAGDAHRQHAARVNHAQSFHAIKSQMLDLFYREGPAVARGHPGRADAVDAGGAAAPAAPAADFVVPVAQLPTLQEKARLLSQPPLTKWQWGRPGGVWATSAMSLLRSSSVSRALRPAPGRLEGV
jgi:hypothetical protein